MKRRTSLHREGGAAAQEAVPIMRYLQRNQIDRTACGMRLSKSEEWYPKAGAACGDSLLASTNCHAWLRDDDYGVFRREL